MLSDTSTSLKPGSLIECFAHLSPEVVVEFHHKFREAALKMPLKHARTRGFMLRVLDGGNYKPAHLRDDAPKVGLAEFHPALKMTWNVIKQLHRKPPEAYDEAEIQRKRHSLINCAALCELVVSEEYQKSDTNGQLLLLMQHPDFAQILESLPDIIGKSIDTGDRNIFGMKKPPQSLEDRCGRREILTNACISLGALTATLGLGTLAYAAHTWEAREQEIKKRGLAPQLEKKELNAACNEFWKHIKYGGIATWTAGVAGIYTYFKSRADCFDEFIDGFSEPLGDPLKHAFNLHYQNKSHNAQPSTKKRFIEIAQTRPLDEMVRLSRATWWHAPEFRRNRIHDVMHVHFALKLDIDTKEFSKEFASPSQVNQVTDILERLVSDAVRPWFCRDVGVSTNLVSQGKGLSLDIDLLIPQANTLKREEVEALKNILETITQEDALNLTKSSEAGRPMPTRGRA